MLYGVLLVAVFLIAVLYRSAIFTLGKKEAEKEILEHENEAIANRPITDDDLVAKLRDKSANARKNYRKP